MTGMYSLTNIGSCMLDDLRIGLQQIHLDHLVLFYCTVFRQLRLRLWTADRIWWAVNNEQAGVVCYCPSSFER